MSRKSTRKSVRVAEESSEEHEEVVQNEGKKGRAKISNTASTTTTPARRSTRSINSAPLYNLHESSEDSPSPKHVATRSSKSGKPVLRLPRKSNVKADDSNVSVSDVNASTSERLSRPKRGNVQQVVVESTEEPARRSTRAAKPPQRLVHELGTTLSGSDTATDAVTPTLDGSEEQNRKSARTRKAATSITPTSIKKIKRGVAAAAAAVFDTPETPRSSRKNTQSQKPTSVKSKTPSTPAAGPKVSQLAEVVQGKKLEWKFNVYGIPKCPLPCREAQFEEIWKFLFENVTEKNSGCMYVSGVPGTGKTVIVQAVVDTMEKIKGSEKKSLQFKYLYINGLTLSSPDKIWKRMFKGLDLPSKSRGTSTKEALKRLDSYFESHQRNPVILVVDELDQILDKQQSILYQLLEWSSHAKNMFSFVAIFNTMSLPENGLAMRNYSRMGFKRAVFPPYSYEQLQTIVSNMLSTFKTSKLSAESVTLLSRKVAAISGDARRALEIARRAMEIAETSDLSGIHAVSNAFKEIFSSAKIETIKYTSLLEQSVLKAICDEVRCSGVEEVLTAKIYDSVVSKAVYEGMQWPKDEILKGLMRLALMHLVIVEDDFPSLHKRVLLKVPVEDVNFALGIHNDLENP